MIQSEGKCSVPMWINGHPAGYCDEPAYGEQEKNQTRYGNWIRGRFVSGYCPRLACYNHGGPKGPVKEDMSISQ